MLNIAVCEDEVAVCHYIVEKIRASFAKSHCEVSITEYCDPCRLLRKTEAGIFYDIYFLDIEMPGQNGIALAQSVRSVNGPALIIFISSKEEMVYASIRVKPLRFIRKDHLDEEIDEAIAAVLQAWSRSRVLLLERSGKEIYLHVQEVRYVESLLRTQIIHTLRSDIEWRGKMKDLEDQLVPFGFLIPHKSFLVNYRYVRSMETDCLFLDDGTEIPVSKHRVQEVKSSYRKLVQQL